MSSIWDIVSDTIDKQGLEPLISTLSRIGGWPMIMDPDEWDEQEYSWQKVDDQYMRLMGKNSFHDVHVYHAENDTIVVHVPVSMYTHISFILSSPTFCAR